MTCPTSPRSSSHEGPPGCWGRYRGDDECSVCSVKGRCRLESKYSQKRPTVREAVRAATRAVVAKVDPLDLCEYAQEVFIGVGGKTPYVSWFRDKRYLEVMCTVAASCAAAGVDPRLFVRAQVETAGYAAVKGGWPMAAGCFRGANADARFTVWMEKQQANRATVGRDRAEVRRREQFLVASAVFATTYIVQWSSVDDAIKAALTSCEFWCADDMDTHAKLFGLSTALDTLRPGLSDRVLLPPARWTWPDARRFAAAIMEFDEQPTVEDPVLTSSDDGLEVFV